MAQGRRHGQSPGGDASSHDPRTYRCDWRLPRAEGGSALALEQVHRQERQYFLTLLVLDAVRGAHDAAIGLRARGLLVHHFKLGVERVAGAYGPEPAQLIEARRAHAGDADRIKNQKGEEVLTF